MYDNLPDDVIRSAAAGNPSAMNEIVSFYERFVYQIAYSALLDREDALDVTQEVFLKIFRFIGRFHFECAFSTWVYTITKNTVSDFFRSRKRHGSVSLNEAEAAGEGWGAAERTGDVDERIIEEERKRQLYRAIGQLSEHHREVIVLYHFAGMSYDQIAVLLGVQPGTVKSRLHRAKAELKKILTERNFL